MTYPTPSDLNVTTWTELLQWSNQVTNYMMGNLIIFAIFSIAFITFIYVDKPEKAFAFSSFIATIMALLLSGIGIVSTFVLVLCFISTAIGILLLKNNN